MPKESAIRAVSKYHKTHMKPYTFRFNKKTQADIIEHLESQENKAGYIANLIKRDIIAQGKQPLVRKRVCDVVKDINDDTIVVLLFKDNSRMIANKQDFINDKRYVEDYSEEDGQLFIRVRYL